LVIAWRETLDPSVRRTIDSGPASHSRATMCKRVSSPSAENMGAASEAPAEAEARDRDTTAVSGSCYWVCARYFSISFV
jgi:hypothetical protein